MSLLNVKGTSTRHSDRDILTYLIPCQPGSLSSLFCVLWDFLLPLTSVNNSNSSRRPRDSRHASFAVSALRVKLRILAHFSSFQFGKRSWSVLKPRAVSTLHSSWKMSRRRQSRSRVPNLLGNRTSCCEYREWKYISLKSVKHNLGQKPKSYICLFSELNSLDTGLLLEVWDKGMLWDKAIGYFWAPLQNLKCSKVVSLPFPPPPMF